MVLLRESRDVGAVQVHSDAGAEDVRGGTVSVWVHTAERHREHAKDGAACWCRPIEVTEPDHRAALIQALLDEHMEEVDQ